MGCSQSIQVLNQLPSPGVTLHRSVLFSARFAGTSLKKHWLVQMLNPLTPQFCFNVSCHILAVSSFALCPCVLLILFHQLMGSSILISGSCFHHDSRILGALSLFPTCLQLVAHLSPTCFSLVPLSIPCSHRKIS